MIMRIIRAVISAFNPVTPAKSGVSMFFQNGDSTTSYAESASTTIMKPAANTAFSLVLRFFPVNDGAGGATYYVCGSGVFATVSNSVGRWQLAFTDGNLRFITIPPGGTPQIIISLPCTVGQWHTAVITRSTTGQVSFYLDSQANVATATANHNLSTNTNRIRIGSEGTFHCDLIPDRMLWYTSELSAAQAGDCMSGSYPASPFHDLTFNENASAVDHGSAGTGSFNYVFAFSATNNRWFHPATSTAYLIYCPTAGSNTIEYTAVADFVLLGVASLRNRVQGTVAYQVLNGTSVIASGSITASTALVTGTVLSVNVKAGYKVKLTFTLNASAKDAIFLLY